jgi:hypothetical protein
MGSERRFGVEKTNKKSHQKTLLMALVRMLMETISGRRGTRTPMNFPGKTACFEKSGGEMGGEFGDSQFQMLLELWKSLDSAGRSELLRMAQAVAQA